MSKIKKSVARESKKTVRTKKPKFEQTNLNDLKFKLSNDQIDAIELIKENDITVLVGKAGTGKTACACYAALFAYNHGEIDKIMLTRPMVGTEDMGFLPGGLGEKYTPWLEPIYSNFGKMFNKHTIEGMIRNEIIEMKPLQFVRGITFENAYVIIDEFQNINIGQTKLILSRIGQGSKIILCGDTDQIDLKKKTDSGLRFLVEKGFDTIDGFGICEMTEEHRKKIVIDILEKFSDNEW